MREEVVSLNHNGLLLDSREMLVRLKFSSNDIEELNKGVPLATHRKLHATLVKIWLSSTSITQRAAKIRPGSSSSFLKTVIILQ